MSRTDPVDPQYTNTDLNRMNRAVWMDLINFLLWMGSAVFSSVMCCSGTKAAIKGRWEARKMRRESNKTSRAGKDVSGLSEMERGTVRSARVERLDGEGLPEYDEVVPVVGR